MSINEFVVVFPPWGHFGHFMSLPFHLELLAACTGPRGCHSRGSCKSVWKWMGRLQRAELAQGLSIFHSMILSCFNLKKLIYYWHLIIAHHKTSDVFIGEPLDFIIIFRSFWAGLYLTATELSVFIVYKLPDDSIDHCRSVINIFDYQCISWLLLTIAFIWMI